jgi:hypothetical protein
MWVVLWGGGGSHAQVGVVSECANCDEACPGVGFVGTAHWSVSGLLHFRRVRKISKNDCQLPHVCPSDRFLWKALH